MKNVLFALSCTAVMSASAQIETPQPSPAAEVKQTVGLTEVSVSYSRPSKKKREIFGNLVPYNEMWRTGANKNTMITTDRILIFDKDTLQPGTYAIFTKPSVGTWEVYFYTDTENWGTPENWDDSKVAATASAMTTTMNDVTETFTIGFDNLTSKGADLTFTWDKTKASVSFKVATESQVMADIEKVMNGPSANDYYRAANYYLEAGKDMNQALEWVNKSIEMDGGEGKFWVLRRKALIQAELGDYKGAIETAEKSKVGAEAAGYDNYIKMNEESIAEWSKMVKSSGKPMRENKKM
ncbi:MAG: dihydrolipoamide dehydrogenase [Fluviicola sp. XM-24bin1]|nr:MAG: dihydrolipoamide dehydrogenase [Fluviicola sp. XM-24bin1]